MKTLKLKSVLFALVAIMAISITLVSCEQDEPALLDPSNLEMVEVTTEANSNERNPFFICGGTGFYVLPTVQSEAQCNLYYGTDWAHGTCYWCW